MYRSIFGQYLENNVNILILHGNPFFVCPPRDSIEVGDMIIFGIDVALVVEMVYVLCERGVEKEGVCL